MAHESETEISASNRSGISPSNILEAVIGIILADIVTVLFYPLEPSQFAFSITLVGGILVVEGIHIQRVNHLSRQINGFESRIISFCDNLQTDGGTTDNTRRWRISGGGLIGAFGGALIGAALGSFGGILGVVVGSIIGAAGWHLIERYSIPEDNDEMESSSDMLESYEFRESRRGDEESVGEEQETEKTSQLSELYQILGVVATNPQEQFTSSEIARLTSMETADVERGLHHLHALDKIDQSQDTEEETWLFEKQETKTIDFGELNDQLKKTVEQSTEPVQNETRDEFESEFAEAFEAGFVEAFKALSEQQQQAVAQSVDAFLDAQQQTEEQTSQGVRQAEQVAESAAAEAAEEIAEESAEAAEQQAEVQADAAADVTSESADVDVAADESDDGQELESIKGISPSYADQLRQYGIQSVEHLAQADSETVAADLQLSEKRVTGWIERAQSRE